MRTLLRNLLHGKTLSTDRYVYYDMTIQEQAKIWGKKALANKQKEIPFEVTDQEAMQTLDEAGMTIRAKHKLPIYQTKADLEQVSKDLSDVRERYADYVGSEKKTISDKEFEVIDKLEAKLRKLENQSEEQEQINSQLNQQDHEREDE